MHREHKSVLLAPDDNVMMNIGSEQSQILSSGESRFGESSRQIINFYLNFNSFFEKTIFLPHLSSVRFG